MRMDQQETGLGKVLMAAADAALEVHWQVWFHALYIARMSCHCPSGSAGSLLSNGHC